MANPLGVASDFDVFVKGNFTVEGTHVHGSSAVGGNVVLNGNMSEFGNHMPSGSGLPGLVVGGTVVLNASGRINGPGIAQINSLTAGQSVVSQGLSGSGGRMLYGKQMNVGAVGIDFEQAFEDLSLLSQSMAVLDSTVVLGAVTSGDALNRQLNLGFSAGDGCEVLNLTLAEFLSFKNIQVGNVAAATKSWIINVDLTGYNGNAITQNRNGSDAAADRILWNFYGADTLVLANQFVGSVFAPDLAFTHQNNDLKGQVIAEAFTKIGGQVHDHRYTGDVPPPPAVPEGGSTWLLLAGAMPLLFGLRALSRR